MQGHIKEQHGRCLNREKEELERGSSILSAHHRVCTQLLSPSPFHQGFRAAAVSAEQLLEFKSAQIPISRRSPPPLVYLLA